MDAETVKKHVELVLARARKDAAEAGTTAKDNPLNGWAVHKAVETKAFAEGYAQGIHDVIELLGL